MKTFMLQPSQTDGLTRVLVTDGTATREMAFRGANLDLLRRRAESASQEEVSIGCYVIEHEGHLLITSGHVWRYYSQHAALEIARVIWPEEFAASTLDSLRAQLAEP